MLPVKVQRAAAAGCERVTMIFFRFGKVLDERLARKVGSSTWMAPLNLDSNSQVDVGGYLLGFIRLDLRSPRRPPLLVTSNTHTIVTPSQLADASW